MVGGALAILGIAALAARKGGTEAFTVNATPTTFAGAPAVRVTWKRPRQVSHEDVVQYQIYRTGGNGDQDRLIGKVVGDQREFVDFVRDPYTVTEVFTGDPGETTTEQEDFEEIPGLTPGLPVRYTVVTIFRPKVSLNAGEGTDGGTGTGTGTDTTGEFEISQRSKPSQGVIPVATALPDSPANASSVDFAAVTFRAVSVAGATVYVFQASTDPFFRSNVRTLGRVTTLLPPPVGATVDLGPIDLNPIFPGANQVYWRVGVTGDPQGDGPFSFGTPALINRAP